MDGDTRRHCGRSGLKPTLGDRIRRGRGDHVHLVAGGGELASQIAQLELAPPPSRGRNQSETRAIFRGSSPRLTYFLVVVFFAGAAGAAATGFAGPGFAFFLPPLGRVTP